MDATYHVVGYLSTSIQNIGYPNVCTVKKNNSTFFIRAHFNGLETGLDVVRIYSGSLQNNMLGLCRDICV
jgi:hypothetical protein